MQKRQALRQMEGALSELCHQLRTRAVAARAQIEALLDFPDDEIPDSLLTKISEDVTSLKADIEKLLEKGKVGEKIRNGIYITIIGAPNAGKSTLLNCLAGRNVAITSEEAGTTRDIIEVSLDINGYSVILADTAGIHETENKVEQEGIKRAKERADNSDIQLHLFDGTTLTEQSEIGAVNGLCVVNKSDLMDETTIDRFSNNDGIIFISAKNDVGIKKLLSSITKQIEGHLSGGDTALLSRARHRKAFEEAHSNLSQYENYDTLDLKAEALRRAAIEIGKVTGEVHIEDVLDVLFSSFCIGK
jgi:tRNA modification GTPase